jgi:hypothetical protein
MISIIYACRIGFLDLYVDYFPRSLRFVCAFEISHCRIFATPFRLLDWDALMKRRDESSSIGRCSYGSYGGPPSVGRGLLGVQGVSGSRDSPFPRARDFLFALAACIITRLALSIFLNVSDFWIRARRTEAVHYTL